MKHFRWITAAAIAVLVSGCGASYTPDNVSQRVATPALASTPVAAPARAAFDVTEVNVIVPRSLIASEANSYYPAGDIVWRGDPPGDRHEQVQAIFETAFTRGTSSLDGSVPAVLDVQVERFHSVTEKTRYTIGGVHSIRFAMVLRDAETGQMLSPPRVVKANLKSYAGQRAIEADRQGQTQKVRITDHLARVIQSELSAPQPVTTPQLALIEAPDSEF
ncbi:MAG: DUF6778 family protein [Pseudomonadota bacterium]